MSWLHSSMKIDEEWERWTLCATKNKGMYRGGEGTIQKSSLSAKPPTSGAGKYKVMMKKKKTFASSRRKRENPHKPGSCRNLLKLHKLPTPSDRRKGRHPDTLRRICSGSETDLFDPSKPKPLFGIAPVIEIGEDARI